MQLLEISTENFPMWLAFKGIPLKLMSREGLSYMASVVGIPLHMDRATGKLPRVTSAKIDAEVNLNEEIPEFVEVGVEKGETFNIAMDCKWRPKCQSRGAFGLNLIIVVI